MALRHGALLLAVLAACAARGGSAHDASGWEPTSQCGGWVSVSSQYQVRGGALGSVSLGAETGVGDGCALTRRACR